MWDFLKGLLGLPRLGDHSQWERSDSYEDSDSSRSAWNPQSFSEKESADELLTHTPFAVFTNPLEMHSYFEKQMDELMKRVFDFGGIGLPKITLDGNETSVDVSVDPHHSSPGNLRDEFLKSELSDNLRQDSDLDGHVGTNDIQRFMGTPSPKLQTPKIFSKSVTIRSVRRPDGSIETVRTERDHTGREETTVTQQGPGGPGSMGPSLDDPNAPLGVDIFSKLFSF